MEKKRPNLLYIFADQWRRHAVGIRQEDAVVTPNIDQFCAESLVFNHALSCTPLCSPHRAALLTGKYPQSTGVYTNCKIGADVMLSPDEDSIGDVLKRSGYSTGYIGKWHLDLPEQNLTPEPVSGARDWDAYTPPGPKRHGFDFWYSYGADDEHLAPHYWKDSPEQIKINQWSLEHETDVAIDFLSKQSKERPFALFLSWNPPHPPLPLVPDKYKECFKNVSISFRPNVPKEQLNDHTGGKICEFANLETCMRDYLAAISGMDDQFGRLLKELAKLDLQKDTIIVLSADHGELMGSHGLMGKHSWHEESIGIPNIIHWPNRIGAGHTDLLFNSVDIMPTLLGLLGEEVPEQVEGRDYSKTILHGDQAKVSSAFISAFPGRKEAIEAFAREGLDNRKFGWRGLRTLRYTYVVHKGYAPSLPTERLLYDNIEDPYQMNPEIIVNASEHPIASHLEEDLNMWLEKTNDLFDLTDIV